MMNLKRLAIIALFAILATACSTQKPITDKGPTEVTPSDSKQSIEELLVQAKSAQPIRAAELKLHAAKLMMLREKHEQASSLLNTIAAASLPDNLSFNLLTTKAQAAIYLNRGAKAIGYLNSLLADETFNNRQLGKKYQLLANAYGLTNQLDQQIIALVTASQYLSDDSQLLALNEEVWSLFKTFDLYQLQQLESLPQNSYSLRGWLALMIKFKETPFSEKMLANQWHKQWSNHVAAKFQPQELADFLVKKQLKNTRYSYQHVAVALPKSGRYAKGANAILKGIKYAAAQTPSLQISYIDSAVHSSAAQILLQAEQIGAGAIIGPLDKNLVSQFAQMNELTLPVLALNNASISNSNLYQYALGNEDEVRGAAVRAYQDGRRNALVLVPESEQGNLAAETFINQFSSLGGNILSTTQYNTDTGNLTNAIANMLRIDQGSVRALQKKLKTAHLRDEIRNMTRRDADAIFLFSSASEAYQIGPSILYFYADHIPLYTTSKVYRGKPNPNKDIDLNGMMFGDLPWVLTPSSHKQGIAAKGIDTRLGRLYAFGMDALNVAPRLYELSTQPQTSYTGETGKLTVSADNLVQKTLIWAKFVNGSPQLLPSIEPL